MSTIEHGVLFHASGPFAPKYWLGRSHSFSPFQALHLRELGFQNLNQKLASARLPWTYLMLP
ncbi:hypothetical protein [Thioalkalivibrio sp. ALE11]|uniref:hypothetical protein n=1 Tax=Thioalkalivibrio sp. ALE11 TaxID=1265494 RepID=UPI0012DF8F4A|nr:hypothetical protein [Thioalkalivibrio sp. ALE11]